MRYSTHCICLQSCQLGPRTLDCTIFWLQWVGKNVENYICLTIFRLGFVKKKDRVQVSQLINDVKWKKFCATLWIMAFDNNYWLSTFDTFTIFRGAVAVSMDIKMLDIDQCPDRYHVPNAFKETHKCDDKSSYVSTALILNPTGNSKLLLLKLAGDLNL